MEYSKSVGIQVEEEGMRYVNRGDPDSPDFTKIHLTFDNAWHELDLSAIVPAASAEHLVHLRIDWGAAGAAIEGYLREKGNVNFLNAERYITKDGATHSRDGWVTMDTSRVIEYRVSEAMDTFNITIRGWWVG